MVRRAGSVVTSMQESGNGAHTGMILGVQAPFLRGVHAALAASALHGENPVYAIGTSHKQRPQPRGAR